MSGEISTIEIATRLNSAELLLKTMLQCDLKSPRFSLAHYMANNYPLMIPSMDAVISSCLFKSQQYGVDTVDDVRENNIFGEEDSDDIRDVSDDFTSGLQDIDSLELWKAIRKLSDKKTKLVLKTIYDNQPVTFGELLKITELNVNDTNHVLGNLRQSNLVIRTEDKKYYLTKYCIALLDALRKLKLNLSEINPSEFSTPALK
jgi:predicted transcriptional regulator